MFTISYLLIISLYCNLGAIQQTRGVGPMLGWRWQIVYDADPTSVQHLANASSLLGMRGKYDLLISRWGHLLIIHSQLSPSQPSSQAQWPGPPLGGTHVPWSPHGEPAHGSSASKVEKYKRLGAIKIETKRKNYKLKKINDCAELYGEK